MQYLVPRSAARRRGRGREVVQHARRQAQPSISGGGGTVELCDGTGGSDPVGRRDLDGADVVAVVVAGPGVHIPRKKSGTCKETARIQGCRKDADRYRVEVQERFRTLKVMQVCHSVARY